jgi:hypothetical protein
MDFMNHPDSLALHALNPVTSAQGLQLVAQIALKTANFLSSILRHA